MANKWQIKTPLARTASGGKFLKGFVKRAFARLAKPKKAFFPSENGGLC